MKVVLQLILLVAAIAIFNTEAASLTASFSISMSTSMSGTWSGSSSPTYSSSSSLSTTGSGSWSASSSFSGSAAPTLSSTLSFKTLSPSLTLTTSFGVPPGVYKFENHCAGQSTAVCPFWQPNTFFSYRLTIMNSSGGMLTYDNIKIPAGEVPQFPLSYDSTNGFIMPGGTYRLDLYGCNSAGQCINAWTSLVAVLNTRRQNVCDPNYLCRVNCQLISSGLVECTWINSNIIRLKRAILKVSACYNINTFVRVALGPRSRRRTITVRNPTPIPTSLRLQIPTGSLCNVQFIARYHPVKPINKVFRYYFFT